MSLKIKRHFAEYRGCLNLEWEFCVVVIMVRAMTIEVAMTMTITMAIAMVITIYNYSEKWIFSRIIASKK